MKNNYKKIAERKCTETLSSTTGLVLLLFNGTLVENNEVSGLLSEIEIEMQGIRNLQYIISHL